VAGLPRTHATWLVPVGIAVLAFAVRLASLLHAGGFHALVGYDEGVYFAGATSLVHGLIPYRDFALVHPPGSTVLLAPFAWVGRLTSEPTGWALARLAVMVLGAATSVLVYLIARRVSLVAGLVAGGLYAVWAPVVHVERTTMLEGFVLAALVVALWAIRTRHESTARLLLAGAALGLGASAKLWGLVPLVVIVGWLIIGRAWRPAFLLVVAALASFAVIVLPFLLMAPTRMLDLVILGQAGRATGATRDAGRLGRMLNVDISVVASHPGRLTAIGLVGLALVLVMMTLAWWRIPVSRLWVAMLGVQVVVLLIVPVYFAGYSSFIGPALMLVTGVATSILWNAVAGRSSALRSAARTALLVVLVAVAVLSGFRAVRAPADLRPHASRMADSVASAHCVGSDSAGLLILADVMGRNIDRGCPTVIEFDGMIYTMDAGANPQRLSSRQRRLASTEYQQAMRNYFAASDLLLLHRGPADAFDPRTRAALAARPLEWRQPGLRVLGLARP
jgi:alpha-1,2-mannosyltransferase